MFIWDNSQIISLKRLLLNSYYYVKMGKKSLTQKIITHFDLGGSKISGLAGWVEEDGTLTILGEERHDYDEIKAGVIEKVSDVAFKINELSKYLQNSLRIDQIRQVSISVIPKKQKQTFRTITQAIPKTVTQEFLNKIKAQLKADINTESIYVFDIQETEYFIDGRFTNKPVGQSGTTLRVDYRIVTGSLKVQESIERCFERTGIELENILLGIDALAVAVLEEEDKEKGCALISFGATTTTLGVFNEGKLQELFLVPLGGLNITKDIEELGIKYEYAEKLKCLKGCALESRVTVPINIKAPAVDTEKGYILISTSFLATIIEARLSEMLDPVFDVINQITYRLPNGIIITGGAAKLNHLDEFISEKTGLQVHHGKHGEWLSEDTPEIFYQPEYSQAVGAMLLVNELNKIVNIEPKVKRKFFGKMKKSLGNKVLDIFNYDEMGNE
ncbi:MAG: cell division protein FtsA [Paludibacteraceae bacterium]